MRYFESKEEKVMIRATLKNLLIFFSLSLSYGAVNASDPCNCRGYSGVGVHATQVLAVRHTQVLVDQHMLASVGLVIKA
jgi:hypothetical protein